MTNLDNNNNVLSKCDFLTVKLIFYTNILVSNINHDVAAAPLRDFVSLGSDKVTRVTRPTSTGGGTITFCRSGCIIVRLKKDIKKVRDLFFRWIITEGTNIQMNGGIHFIGPAIIIYS